MGWCEDVGGRWVLDPDDQGAKTEVVNVTATQTTVDDIVDNVSWFIGYALAQTFGQSLGAFQTMSSTHDPIDFALAGAVVVAPMGGEESEEITITKRALRHITTGELRNGKTLGSHLIFVAGKKSAFNLGEDVVRLVKAAEAAGPVKQSTGRNFERIIDAGRPIGMDRATGQLTSIIYCNAGPGSLSLGATKALTKHNSAAKPSTKFCARSFILECNRHAIVLLRIE